MFDDFEFEDKYNPWDVQSLEEFLYYCCPECPSKNVTKTDFIKHALEAHPQSQGTIEFLEDNKAVIKSENESNKEVHPLEKDPLLSKKAVVSLPKLSDAFIRKYTKVFEKKNFEQPNVGKVPLHPKSITCDKCEKSFSSKQGLYFHIRSFHENVRYNCDKCDKRYSDKSSLNRHMQSVHENVQFNCDHCDKRFSHKDNLNIHIKNVHDHIRYNCEKCGKSFSQKGNLNTHIKSVHDDLQYNCDKCDKSFPYKSHLNRHMKSRHENDKSLTYMGTLKTHIKTVHENSDKYLKNFTKTHLNESTVEGTNDKIEELEKNTTVTLRHTIDHSYDLNCFEQENRTSLIGPKKMELVVSTPAKQNDFLKPIMKARNDIVSFQTEQIMQMIPFRCYPSLDHNYVEKNNMDIISNTKKSIIITAKYKCDKCERSFDKKTNFYIHMQSEHGSFYCEKCDKSFSQKGTLKTHIQSVHENVRYNCDKCDKSFSQKGNLNVHVRSVHKKVRYDCDKCEKSFWWKGELKEHTYIHTKKVELIVPTPKQNDFLRPIMKARNDNNVSHHKVVHVNQPKQFGNYFKHKEVYQYYDKKK